MSESLTFIKEYGAHQQGAVAAEVQGLTALRTALLQLTGARLRVPQILAQSDYQLQLERIYSCTPTQEDWVSAAQSLAEMHNVEQPSFGWQEDNFIGLNPQLNRWCDNWGAFFVEYRLKPQIGWIKERSLAQAFSEQLNNSATRLIKFLNARVTFPSLVHGDLWSGNLMHSQQGPWLIDPAVYCADAEVDVAMTKMFGGFPDIFYQTYRQIRPQPADADTLCSVYNLYHALNHLNLFGNSYLSDCQRGFALLEEL